MSCCETIWEGSPSKIPCHTTPSPCYAAVATSAIISEAVFAHDNGPAGIDVDELKGVLNEELNQLPAKYRLPMILHYYGGLTREQIAAELGCKPSTLGVRIHRGRQMLAKRLTLRGASPVAMGMSLAVGLSLAVRSAVSDGMVASTSHAAAKLMAGEQLGSMISSHVLSVAQGAAGAAMIAKFKLVAAVVVAAVVLGVGAGATAKVLPLDQLRLQLPFTFDGKFRLPAFRSPFRAPQASAAGAGGAWSSPLQAAARSAAAAAPVRRVMWMAQEDLVARSRATAPGGGSSGLVARGAFGGIGTTGRLLARVVSSLVSSTIANTASTANGATPDGSTVATAVAAARPASTAINADVVQATPAARVPPPTASSRLSQAAGGGGGSLHIDGDVAFSKGGSVNALPSPRATGGASDTASLPLPPRTSVAVGGSAMTIAGNPGSRGAVRMDRGHLEADLEVIGGRGHGEFHQRGGTNVATDVRLGVEPGSYGEYRLDGGELIFKPPRTPPAGTPRPAGLEVGDQGTGVFLFGNANGTGDIDTRWNSPGSSLVVRGDPSGVGVFRGWGSVAMSGFFNMNGQAVADGYGSDRTLEFRGFRYVGNGIENPADGGTAGWYARDHGKLVLPVFHVRPGTAAYTFGEDPGDPTLDLVNSARLTLHDVVKAGLMQVSLVSKDNADVPALPRGHTFIGVWQLEAEGLEHGDVDIVVRYDDALAHELHLNENILKLWRYQDGQWIRMDHDATFWRDVNQHLLGVTAPAGGFDFFAVSAPEPGAIGAVVLGAGFALLRRPRRRKSESSRQIF